MAGVDVDTRYPCRRGRFWTSSKGKPGKARTPGSCAVMESMTGSGKAEDRGALFLDRPIGEWLKPWRRELKTSGMPKSRPERPKSLERPFLPCRHPSRRITKNWLWMLEPEKASDAQKKAWRSAPRSSFEEMARRASQDDFHARRLENRAEEISGTSCAAVRPRERFSADELPPCSARSRARKAGPVAGGHHQGSPRQSGAKIPVSRDGKPRGFQDPPQPGLGRPEPRRP